MAMAVEMKADRDVTLTLTAAEWVAIRRMMGRAPYDDVGATIAKMDAQLRAAAKESES
jgi:hypothetical protein